ncbi:MAG: hypothetical protein P8Y38_00025 [Deltaproteobacteria bacterium]|jgi:hypothetical protein
MNNSMNTSDGLRRLIEKHRRMFRIPENVNFYSAEDYLAAERKYLKAVLLYGNAMYAGSNAGTFDRDKV